MEESLKGGIAVLGEKVDSIKEKVDIIKENVVTKEDMKDCIEEIMRQHPCFEEVKTVWAR